MTGDKNKSDVGKGSWYRGPLSDWLRAIVISPLVVFTGWLALYLELTAPEIATKDVGDISAVFATIPWTDGISTSAPYALALVPVVVVAIRWYYAGEPLPTNISNQPYNVFLVITTALQAFTGVFAWSVWGYTIATGMSMEQVLLELPAPAVKALVWPIFLGGTVGMVGPALCMYLDARYLDDRELLHLFDGDYLLIFATVLGIQFAAIPTVAAVWHYLNKRKRAAPSIDEMVTA